MNILALDTATPICSIALSSEKGKWYIEIDAGQRHSELFMEAADLLMKTGGLQPDALDLVACMKGPGSFTGLRIGFAAAKGLCLALGIPLITIPTLDCMAFPGQSWPGIVMPAMDAKKRCYFTALYRGRERLTDYMDAEVGDIARLVARSISGSAPGNDLLLLTGPDAELLQSALRGLLEPPLRDKIRLDPGRRKGKAQELLEMVSIELEKRGGIIHNDDTEVFSGPLYLRKSDAELHLRPR